MVSVGLNTPYEVHNKKQIKLKVAELIDRNYYTDTSKYVYILWCLVNKHSI